MVFHSPLNYQPVFDEFSSTYTYTSLINFLDHHIENFSNGFLFTMIFFFCKSIRQFLNKNNLHVF